MIYLLIIIASWRELNILIKRGSWKAERFKKFLFWETPHSNKWISNFDSYHASGGLFWLLVFTVLVASKTYPSWLGLPILTLVDAQPIGFALNITIYWLAFMYLRNICLHILFPKWEKGNPNLRLWYLIPIGGLFKR